MNTGELIKRMIDFYQGNLHDINHFLKVYAYAKAIGECEGLDELTQTSLEVAAILHDIACPLCREKYGNADGPYQEQEGPALAIQFLKGSGLPQPCVGRVVYLVGHPTPRRRWMARTIRFCWRRTTWSTWTRASSPGGTLSKP